MKYELNVINHLEAASNTTNMDLVGTHLQVADRFLRLEELEVQKYAADKLNEALITVASNLVFIG